MNSVAAITIPTSHNEGRTRTVIVSASADSSVRIWDRKQSGGENSQSDLVCSSVKGKDRQTNIQTDRKTDRQTNRQALTDRYIYRQINFIYVSILVAG